MCPVQPKTIRLILLLLYGWNAFGCCCCAAAVANWNDDKSNFIKYRYMSLENKSCWFHSLPFVRSWKSLLLQYIECGCNHTYHTTKFLRVVSSYCVINSNVSIQIFQTNAHTHANKILCMFHHNRID